MSKLIGLLAASALAAGSSKGGGSPMQWNGAFCPVEKPSHRAIESPADWKKLWEEIGKPAPAADLEKGFAVAVFLGSRPTGGWSAAFEEPVEEKGVLVVRYAVKAPKGMAFQAFTQPYAVRLFPRSGKPVRVEMRKS